MGEAAQQQPEQQLAPVSPIREQALVQRGLAMDATTFEGIHSVFSNGTAFQLAVKMATLLAESTIMPEAYQGNPANCLIAIDYAARLAVSPVMLAQNMDVVKGRPGLRGTFLAGLINACPLFERLKYEWRGTDNPGKDPSDDFGCRAYAKEAATGETLYGTWIDWRMVKAEEWNKNKKWSSMREQMFMYRAASFWSRAHASDVTLGLYEAEEIRDMHDAGEPGRLVATAAGIASLGERLRERAQQPAIEHESAQPKQDEPLVDGGKLRGRIFIAESLEEIDEAAADISLLPEGDEKHEINELYLKRRAEIEAR